MQTWVISSFALYLVPALCVGEGEVDEVVAVYGLPVHQDNIRASKSLLNTFPFNQPGFGGSINEGLNLDNEQSRLTVNRGVAREAPKPVLSSISGYQLLRD